jgi:hypothetical protein
MHSTARAAVAFVAGTWLAAGPAAAAPVLVVDTDPSTPGIQAEREVVVGERFSATVAVIDVEAPSSLHAYEFDLSFASAVVDVLDATDAGFLRPEVFILESTLGGSPLGFAATTIGQLGSTGSGPLTLLELEAIDVGTSPLDLSAVVLSEPDGIEILDVALHNGVIHVVAPEPTVLGMWLVPLVLALRRRRAVRDG